MVSRPGTKTWLTQRGVLMEPTWHVDLRRPAYGRWLLVAPAILSVAPKLIVLLVLLLMVSAVIVPGLDWLSHKLRILYEIEFAP